MENGLDVQSSLSWLIRAKTFDDAIKSFIHKHPILYGCKYSICIECNICSNNMLKDIIELNIV